MKIFRPSVRQQHIVLRAGFVAQRRIVVGLLFLFSIAFIKAQSRGLDVVARTITGDSSFNAGRQYAVIIGIDKYTEWPALRSAVGEAQAIKKVLAERYVIDKIFELYDQDATAANIRRLFMETLPKEIGQHDSLLVFYAGHGQTDSTKTGFWIASDGSSDVYSQNNWIPNGQIRNMIGSLSAQRILILADACFSGDFLNVSRGSLPTINNAFYKKALQLTARQVLTSGASETVPDDSEFGEAILNILRRSDTALLDPISMYERVRLGVTKTLPLLGSMPGNEEGASFVLFLRDDKASQKGLGSPGILGPQPSNGGGSAELPKTDGAIEVSQNSRTPSAPSDEKGWITFLPSMPGIKCSIDGAKSIAVEGTANGIACGSRNLLFEKPGYRTKTLMVKVSPDAGSNVSVALEKMAAARLTFPSFGINLGFAATTDEVKRDKTGGSDLGLSSWQMTAGLPIKLVFTSPYARRIDIPAIETTFADGEAQKLELPNGRIFLPWLPIKSKVLIGEAPHIVLMNTVTMGFCSAPLPPGEYAISVGSSYTGSVTVVAGDKAEPTDYQSVMTAGITAERNELEKGLPASRARLKAAWISLTSGLVGVAGAGAVYFYFGNQAMLDYRTAITRTSASAAWNNVELMEYLFPISAAVGGIGIGISTYLFVGHPGPKTLQRSIDDLDAGIKTLSK